MPITRVATEDEWLAARRLLLAEEKDFTRLRDQLSARRRAMPWLRIDKDYRFDGPEGQNLGFGDLFSGRRQLIVYHFMFGPDWEKPCKNCSFWADGYNGVTAHLAERDTRLVAVSRAPFGQARGDGQADGLELSLVFLGRRRLQLRFPRLVPPRADGRRRRYPLQLRPTQTKMTDLPGISAFIREPDGAIYRTYSAYARGLDMLNPAYQLLDITALGRHEDDLPFPMAWVKLHDEYAA